ncbi:MAG: P-II family nitrogen regulator [Bacillota bacterium]|jgi:nitrogen regulatory protein P-II 1|nr:P-II family nitrogen regulator [Bacillota bacterium]HPZ14645.1 P-II family nitrogen regulator [Bacillota bacterium]
MRVSEEYDLIVTIINKGWADEVVEASRRAGAEGGTILYGRGTGVHEQKTFFGILIEPEKEVVLTLIPRSRTDAVMEAVVAAGQLEKPGTGIAFVLDASKVAGIVHRKDAE